MESCKFSPHLSAFAINYNDYLQGFDHKLYFVITLLITLNDVARTLVLESIAYAYLSIFTINLIYC